MINRSLVGQDYPASCEKINGDAVPPLTTNRAAGERLLSLDVFRGLVIVTMIFVNFLYNMPGVPFFLEHAPAKMDAFTLADIVFPAFLFIVGVALPMSLNKRRTQGQPISIILGHIALRAAVLIFLGVIMVNRSRYSAELTGLSVAVWYFTAYVATVVLWQSYPKPATPQKKWLYVGLRVGAAATLIVLTLLFKGETKGGEVTWLRHSWWGILGVIGWTYLAGSFVTWQPEVASLFSSRL